MTDTIYDPTHGDLVLTCLLANLCSQLGLQRPSPQLVVPSSPPILLPGFPIHFALPDQVRLRSGGADVFVSNATAALTVSAHLYLLKHTIASHVAAPLPR